MPSKKRSKVKTRPRKAVAVPSPQGAPDDTLSLLANPSDLRALEIFFTQTRGFRLALALHDDMRVRDRVNQHLQEKLQVSGVDLLLVDLRTQSPDTSLLGSAAAAFAAHQAKPRLADSRAALVLVNLESRVNYNPELCNGEDQKSAYLATANLQRDLWPTTFDGPVLIWMPELLEPALAKWAPDLWHWRSHVFDLRKAQQEETFVASADSRASRFDFNDETKAASVQHLVVLQTQLDAYRKAGMRGDEGRILAAIGQERLKLGQAEIARQNFEAGLVIAREQGDRRDEGSQLGLLGTSYYSLGESRCAVNFYEQALAIAREINNKNDECIVLSNLAGAWKELGAYEFSVNFYEQALVIASEIGNKRYQGEILGNLGNVWADLRESRRAVDCYEKALIIAHEVGNKRAQNSHLGNLGNVWKDWGEPFRASELHEQALVIACEIGDKYGEGSHLGNLGIAWSILGEINRAIDYHKQAVSIFREIGDKRGEGQNLFNLAVSLRKIDSPVEQQHAVVLAQEALNILESIESPHANKLKAKLAEWQAEK